MSFRVLVIPEDPTWNGYILKPLTKALLNDAGKPNAKVKQAGGGRELMITRSLQNLQRLFQLCPETRRLRDRIAEHVEAADA